MFLNGRWATPNFLSQVEFDWDVAEVPVGPGGQSNFLFWGAYVVNANTENPEAAWELANRLTALDAQTQVTALGANLPSRVSDEAVQAFLDSTPEINNAAWVNALQNYAVAEAPLWKGDFGQINWNTVEPAIAEVLTGVTTPEDFTSSICDDIAQYFNN
jgi:multiple sugar transport system substrate-binding protein